MSVAYYMATQRTAQPKLEKTKQIHLEKKSLYFVKRNFLTLKLKSFLYFLKRKLFLYFRKWNPALSGLSRQIFSPKEFLIFFPKRSCSEKFSYIFSKKPPALIFRKRNFLILRERYIQNPGIFRTRGIFRTLSNIYYGMFLQKQLPSALSDLDHQNFFPKKFPIFFPKKPALKTFLIFPQKEPLILQKWKSRKNPYTLGNETFLFFRKPNFLILQETELSYTSGNGTFLYFGKGIFKTRCIFRTTSILRTLTYSEPWNIQSPRHIENTVKHL